MSDKPLLPGQRPEGWQAPPAVKKPKGCGTWLLIGGGVFVALVVLGTLAGPPPRQKPEASPAAGEATGQVIAAPLAVSAAELYRAYDANEMAAQQRFGGQALKVSGRVSGVQLGLGDEPYLLLAGPEMFQTVHAEFIEAGQAALAGLAKGDKVTLRCGDVRELVGTPMLRDCALEQ